MRRFGNAVLPCSGRDHRSGLKPRLWLFVDRTGTMRRTSLSLISVMGAFRERVSPIGCDAPSERLSGPLRGQVLFFGGGGAD